MDYKRNEKWLLKPFRSSILRLINAQQWTYVESGSFSELGLAIREWICEEGKLAKQKVTPAVVSDNQESSITVPGDVFLRQLMCTGLRAFGLSHIIIDLWLSPIEELSYILALLQRYLKAKKDSKVIILGTQFDPQSVFNQISGNLDISYNLSTESLLYLKQDQPEQYLADVVKWVNSCLLSDVVNLNKFDQHFAYDNIQTENARINQEVFTLAAQLTILLSHFSEEQTIIVILLPGTAEITKMLKDLQSYPAAASYDVIPTTEITTEQLITWTKPVKILLTQSIKNPQSTGASYKYIIDFAQYQTKQLDPRRRDNVDVNRFCSKTDLNARRRYISNEGIVFRMIPQQFYTFQIQDFPTHSNQKKWVLQDILKNRYQFSQDDQPFNTDNFEAEGEDVYILRDIGAVDVHGSTTWLGQIYFELNELGIEISLGQLIIYGTILGCAREAIIIASALSIKQTMFKQRNHMSDPSQRVRNHSIKLHNDANLHSDPLLYTSLFWLWYELFGKNLQDELVTDVQQKALSEAEKNWCTNAQINHTTMREIMIKRRDIERKLHRLGLPRSALETSRGDYRNNPQSELLVKLAISWAFGASHMFAGRYINWDSDKSEEKEFYNHNEKNVLGFVSKADAIIDKEEDLHLHLCSKLNIPESDISVEMDANLFYVTYHNDQNNVQKELTLWLMNCADCKQDLSQYMILETTLEPETRYILDYRILHEKKETDELYENRKNNLFAARDMLKTKLPRFRKFYHKSYYELDSREDPSGNQLELGAHLIPELFTRYAVDYSDLDTGYTLLISDRSVNSFRFDTVGHFNDQLIVAYEYITTRRKTLACETTLLPDLPLIGPLSILLFTKRIELYMDKESSRYDSYGLNKVSSKMYFDYRITGRDIQEINTIRDRLSEAIECQLHEFSSRPDIVDLILQLIYKPRDPIYRQRAELTKFVSMATDYQTVNLYGTETDEPYRFLPQHAYLNLIEDSRIWENDGHEQIGQIESEKQARIREYIDELDEQAKKMDCSQATLI